MAVSSAKQELGSISHVHQGIRKNCGGKEEGMEQE
jgi:hypothetical protein